MLNPVIYNKITRFKAGKEQLNNGKREKMMPHNRHTAGWTRDKTCTCTAAAASFPQGLLDWAFYATSLDKGQGMVDASVDTPRTTLFMQIHNLQASLILLLNQFLFGVI